MFTYCGNNPIILKDTNGDFWDIVFDVVSLVVSVIDVAKNPSDSWAWAGLVGDVVDLIPGVTCVGETIKAVKTGKRVVETIDTTSAVTKTVTKGWKVGDDITKATAKGTSPSWTTIRNIYWKNEAHYNSSKYTQSNLERMRQGKAPLVKNAENGKFYSMELHHKNPRRNGGTHNYSNLQPLSPWDHAAIDKFRNFRS